MELINSATQQKFELADKVISAMKQFNSPAEPLAFEVWHVHFSGTNPALSEAISFLSEATGLVNDMDIRELYEAHVAQSQISRQVQKSSLAIIEEINAIMSVIDSTLGSNLRYDQSLKAISVDLKNTPDRQSIRSIIETLVASTKDAMSNNRLLEKHLSEGRSEIHNLREALETTRADSLTDQLTGLANRRHFEEMLQKTIDQATIKHETFALVMCDIDFFKRFNDQYGHLTGDQVLRLVAKTMQQKLKTTAIPCRYGGEEFAIILPLADLQGGKTSAELVRQALLTRELVIRSTGETIGRVTISLGVAAYRRGDTASGIIERADQCLLEAKRSGRNKTVIELPDLLEKKIA